MARKQTDEGLRKRPRTVENNTVRRAQAMQAQEKEHYYRSLLFTLHEDILVIDRNYQIIDMNNTFLHTTGLKREEVVGRHCYEVSHCRHKPCEQDYEGCKLHEVFETGKPSNCRHQHLKHDGSMVWVDILLSPLKDEKGTVTHVIEAIRDVSDLIEAHEALSESEKRYRSLFEDSKDAIYITTRAGRFVDANQSMVELFGYTKKAMKRMKVLRIYANRGDRVKFQKEIEKKGSVKDYELKFRKKDGKKLDCLVTATLKLSGDGKILGYQGIIRDITAKKQLEERLKKREDELEIKAHSLQEMNTALKVLLERVKEDKKAVEEKMVSNVKELVVPFLKRLQNSHLDEKQSVYATILESNLENIISPFIHTLSKKYGALTPAEIQVAHLIKEGKTSKEIAAFLDISPRTVGHYREQIREKLALKQTKANLRSHLLTIH